MRLSKGDVSRRRVKDKPGKPGRCAILDTATTHGVTRRRSSLWKWKLLA